MANAERLNRYNLVVKSTTYTKDSGKEDGTVINGSVAKFVNDYKPNPTKLPINISKNIVSDGVSPKTAETFQFKMERLSGDENGIQLPEKNFIEITGTGSATFDDIEFTRAGKYAVIVKELKGDAEGFIYDSTIWTIDIEIIDNDGNLEVKNVTYTKDDTNEDNFSSDPFDASKDGAAHTNVPDPGHETNGKAHVATFINRYKVEPGVVSFRVNKNVEGSPMPEANQEEFIFNLRLTYEGTLNGIKNPEPQQITVKGNHFNNFNDIEFTKPGTYRFEITEENNGKQGYTYSQAVWQVEVIVTHEAGVLKTEVHYTQRADFYGDPSTATADEVLFTNKYENKETKLRLDILKRVEGYIPEGRTDTFKFQLTADETNPDLAELPDPAEVELGVTQGYKDFTGSFGEITFHKEGTYHFVVSEVKDDSLVGYSFDDPCTVTVEIVDEDSILKIKSLKWEKAGVEFTGAIDATQQLELRFTNKCNPRVAQYAPSVVKSIPGNPNAEDTFTFELEKIGSYGTDIAMPLPEERKVTVTGEGTASFGILNLNPQSFG